MKKYNKLFLKEGSYKYNQKSLGFINAFAKNLWPKEYKELESLVLDSKGKYKEVDDVDRDRYFELKDFLRDSVMGSISRYWTPGRPN